MHKLLSHSIVRSVTGAAAGAAVALVAYHAWGFASSAVASILPIEQVVSAEGPVHASAAQKIGAAARMHVAQLEAAR